MKSLLLVIFIFKITAAHSQVVEWNSCRDWKLYKISTGKALGFSADSLYKLAFIQIDGDSISQYLKQAELLPPDKNYIWMGSYSVSYIQNAKLYKVDISTHGGFFYDEASKKYYQLPLYIRKDWLDWLSDLKRRVNELK